MEAFKSSAARLANLFKRSRDAWKAKALDRQQRLRAAQIKIRDLEDSRARWKARALRAEGGPPRADAAPASNGDGPADASQGLALSAPAGHRYSAAVMQLSMRMYLDAALGSRGVSLVLTLLGTSLPIGAPAYTSVLNWVYRCGLAVLNRPPERRADWIYIADHTVALGPTKCLVVLGIPAAALAHVGYSPSHRQMQVLAVETATHSTGPWVAGVLARVAQRTGAPVQIVADHGSDLRNGIALFRLQAPACVYTYDISHRLATLLKDELGRDARWQAFLGHCATALPRWQQTDLAFLLPPRQRTKARFMHLDAHVQWAQRLLAYYDRGDFSAIRTQCVMTWTAWECAYAQLGARRAFPLRAIVGIRYPDRAALRQALLRYPDLAPDDLDATFWHHTDTGRCRFLDAFAWLLPVRDDLRDYSQIMAQSKLAQAYLKSNGLCQGVCEPLRAALAPVSALAPRAADFTQRILRQVALEAAKIPTGCTWLASSDIIESVFGKYKCFTARGPLKEIGKLVLAIPAFIADLTIPAIREAMESVRTADVDRWVKTHIGTSMLARRRHALIAPTLETQTA